MESITETLKKFLVLGPSLIKITGNSEKIDALVEKVKSLVVPF